MNKTDSNIKQQGINTQKLKEAEELATNFGYALYSTCHDSTIFVNNEYPNLSLCVFIQDLEIQATLNGIHKMVRLQIGPISFPNKNFHEFERQMKCCLNCEM